MKKILSLALAAAMAVSVLPVAYAAENETEHTNGTQITYIGSQEEAAGGAGDVWTVTVPAKMEPGQTGTIKAEGMWAADKFLQVHIPETVTLSYGAQTMDVAVHLHENAEKVDTSTMSRFMVLGNSLEALEKECVISVEDASRLFGTWTGTLVYTVELTEKGDINRDGVIDEVDYNILSEFVKTNGELTDNISTYGDLNGDGQVKTGDYKMLQAMLQYHGIELTAE